MGDGNWQGKMLCGIVVLVNEVRRLVWVFGGTKKSLEHAGIVGRLAEKSCGASPADMLRLTSCGRVRVDDRSVAGQW